MKLEYKYDYVIMWIAMLIMSISMGVVGILVYLILEIDFIEFLKFISLTLIVIFFSIYNIKTDKKKLKEYGKKVVAEITEVERRRGKHGTYRYSIWVTFENKETRVRLIKYNEAFCILRLLLNAYPVKVKSVPIEIYVHKNRVYADLDSVDLTKVEGYEDAKRATEEAWPREEW